MRTPIIPVGSAAVPKRSIRQLAQHLVMFGESARLFLAVDQFPIDHDIKNSAAALDQFGTNSHGRLNRARQTGGLWRVVSLHAVGD